jgi:hypothetical protein
MQQRPESMISPFIDLEFSGNKAPFRPSVSYQSNTFTFTFELNRETLGAGTIGDTPSNLLQKRLLELTKKSSINFVRNVTKDSIILRCDLKNVALEIFLKELGIDNSVQRKRGNSDPGQRPTMQKQSVAATKPRSNSAENIHVLETIKVEQEKQARKEALVKEKKEAEAKEKRKQEIAEQKQKMEWLRTLQQLGLTLTKEELAKPLDKLALIALYKLDVYDAKEKYGIELNQKELQMPMQKQRDLLKEKIADIENTEMQEKLQKARLTIALAKERKCYPDSKNTQNLSELQIAELCQQALKNQREQEKAAKVNHKKEVSKQPRPTLKPQNIWKTELIISAPIPAPVNTHQQQKVTTAPVISKPTPPKPQTTQKNETVKTDTTFNSAAFSKIKLAINDDKWNKITYGSGLPGFLRFFTGFSKIPTYIEAARKIINSYANTTGQEKELAQKLKDLFAKAVDNDHRSRKEDVRSAYKDWWKELEALVPAVEQKNSYVPPLK